MSASSVVVVSGVTVVVLGVVGLGVVIGILLGGWVVVATRIGILELKFFFPEGSLITGAMSRSFWIAELGSQVSWLPWSGFCTGCKYQGGNGGRRVMSEALGLQV